MVADRRGELLGQQAFGFGTAFATTLWLRTTIRNGFRPGRKGADRYTRCLVELGAQSTLAQSGSAALAPIGRSATLVTGIQDSGFRIRGRLTRRQRFNYRRVEGSAEPPNPES
jgi:hypothetical protein